MDPTQPNSIPSAPIPSAPIPAWRDRACALLADTPIFVDDLGRPVGDRPDPNDFESYGDFFGALWAYRQAAADAINLEFSRALRAALRG